MRECITLVQAQDADCHWSRLETNNSLQQLAPVDKPVALNAIGRLRVPQLGCRLLVLFSVTTISRREEGTCHGIRPHTLVNHTLFRSGGPRGPPIFSLLLCPLPIPQPGGPARQCVSQCDACTQPAGGTRAQDQRIPLFAVTEVGPPERDKTDRSQEPNDGFG